MPGPLTKRELWKFLELIGYRRLWLESYTLKTKTFYSKLLEEEPDPLAWKPEEILIIKTVSGHHHRVGLTLSGETLSPLC
jgi:hypothetical protein